MFHLLLDIHDNESVGMIEGVPAFVAVSRFFLGLVLLMLFLDRVKMLAISASATLVSLRVFRQIDCEGCGRGAVRRRSFAGDPRHDGIFARALWTLARVSLLVTCSVERIRGALQAAQHGCIAAHGLPAHATCVRPVLLLYLDVVCFYSFSFCCSSCHSCLLSSCCFCGCFGC